MRIVIVTDAWRPQVNGVVTTLGRTSAELEEMGHQVLVINPQKFRTLSLPSYPEIRLSVMPGREVSRDIADFDPDHIHIATEGPLGLAARRHCLRYGLDFTTSYHTQFPEYLRERLPVPLGLSYRLMRKFHGQAQQTMVPTNQMRELLLSRGFRNVVLWERGVDTTLFHPAATSPVVPARSPERPIWVYAGRVAVEKNLTAFLDLDLPGTKRVIGDGPQMAEFTAGYPEVEFVGYRFGEELAALVADSDVFVFPSVTDTFGLVMLEAMACGLPVAAFPVTGPIDVVRQGVTGVLDDDLRNAALAALELGGGNCRQEALGRTWRRATEQFFANLVPARPASGVVCDETA